MTADYPAWPDDYAAHYRSAGHWTHETLGGVLRRQARRNGAKLAVVSGNRRITYAELDDRVDSLVAGMRRLGIRKSDRVVVQLPNVAAFHEVCFALFRIGAVPVMALPALRSRELTQLCTASRAVAYIVAGAPGTADFLALAETVKNSVPQQLWVLTVGADSDRFPFLEDFYDTAESTDGTVAQEPAAHDVALLQVAGGTTSAPELVPRTHADYLYTARVCAELSELEPDSVYLAALPVAHNFPLASPGAIGAVLVGATCVLAPLPSPDVVLKLVETERVTHCCVVPSLALVWLAAPVRQYDLSSWLVLQVGGAKCSAELARRIRDTFGCTPQQAYGMAEGIICFTRLDDPTEVVDNTQGRPVSPHDEIRVVDPTGAEVPVGVIGELIARGPYTVRGYYNGVNASHFTEDGFFHTGDLVRLRPDGNIVVEGRLKRQINRGGEKIAAAEVEHHLTAHPDVRRAAVVGVPDGFLGERSCAHIVLHDRIAVDAAELRAFLHQREIAAYKVPDRFLFVSELPVAADGPFGGHAR